MFLKENNTCTLRDDKSPAPKKSSCSGLEEYLQAGWLILVGDFVYPRGYLANRWLVCGTPFRLPGYVKKQAKFD
jgi:hypothetical protein